MTALTPEAVAAACANQRELIGLLRREGRHSGVWFGDKLTEAADLISDLLGRVALLEDGLRAFAQQQTIAERLSCPEDKEWLDASVDRRIEMMGERRRKHDGAILNARALLQADPRP